MVKIFIAIVTINTKNGLLHFLVNFFISDELASNFPFCFFLLDHLFTCLTNTKVINYSVQKAKFHFQEQIPNRWW